MLHTFGSVNELKRADCLALLWPITKFNGICLPLLYIDDAGAVLVVLYPPGSVIGDGLQQQFAFEAVCRGINDDLDARANTE